MEGSDRLRVVAGVVFVITFVVGLALLGEVAGSVGEPDEWFAGHFSSGSERAADIAGSFLLFVAAMAFLFFTQMVGAVARSQTPEQRATWALAWAAGTMASVGLFIAALAFLTVPLSISIGELYDDAAFSEGQAVLPQFGYVALAVGAMYPAAVMIVAIARLAILPRWLTRLSYFVAVLLVATSLAVSPMFILLPGWVALTAFALRRTETRAVH